MELKSGDFSAVESVVLAWFANELWKLEGISRPSCEPVTSGSSPIASLPARCCTSRRTQRSRAGTAARQGRRIAPPASAAPSGLGAASCHNDPAQRHGDQDEYQRVAAAHPAVTRVLEGSARAIRVAIKTGQPILVAPAPRPPIIAAFADGNLTLTLPSGRAITYPNARLVPSKFEDGDPDVQFMDNARGQWQPTREWFGTFVENVVQGTARDLLAAAIDRVEARGIPVVFHCHDEVTVEVPVGRSPMPSSWQSCSNDPTGPPECRSAARCIPGPIISKSPTSRPCRWRYPIRRCGSARTGDRRLCRRHPAGHRRNR